jgi:hypothetical protein
MTVQVTVDAIWRVNRIEIEQSNPYTIPIMIRGSTEVVLQEPTDGEVPSILKSATYPKAPIPVPDPQIMTPKTYGALPGMAIYRKFTDVKDQTVDVDGQTVSMETVMKAFLAFFEAWRIEDEIASTPDPDEPIVDPLK